MSNLTRWGWACALSLCASATILVASPQEANKPLEETRLLALVAGNALPENIVAAIEGRGLAFQPTPEYQTLLTQAGATPEVFSAIGKAAVGAASKAGSGKKDAGSWPHLAAAGRLLREKKYREAQREINAAMEAGAGKLDAGFVMGEALRQREEWMLAVAVYNEIARQDGDFPEAQTKRSFVLYKAGDPEDSFRAAELALDATPNNAEAHKNAGLALERMQKYDAALAEYREALRLKPDYEAVRYNLGILLHNKDSFDALEQNLQSSQQPVAGNN
jgi:tetratricopeptide (TPR) repeat protein